MISDDLMKYSIQKFSVAFLIRTSGIIVILLIWKTLHLLELFNPTLLPSPEASFHQLKIILLSGDVLPDISSTLGRALAGFSLAAFVGVFMGVLLGYFKLLYESLSMIVDFFRSIPVTALYPIFVLFFGIGNVSKIAMIFVAALFVIIFNTAYGVHYSSSVRKNMASLYGANKLQILMWVIFFNALPHIVVGLRVAISYCLIVAIVTEMFMGSEFGIGQRIFEASNTYSIDELYALVVIIGFIGYITNFAFYSIEKNLTRWAVK